LDLGLHDHRVAEPGGDCYDFVRRLGDVTWRHRDPEAGKILLALVLE
jgi:hypothetical protein